MHQAANDNRMTDASGDPQTRGRPCPICGKAAVPEARPFCSKRCADIDLHRWLGGRYAVPAADTDETEGSSDVPDE